MSCHLDIVVLRALLRLSRRRAPATVKDLLQHVGGVEIDLSRALGALARAELVQRQGETVRLTLPGLAVACAAAATARRAKTVARPTRHARVVPMIRTRRHRAA